MWSRLYRLALWALPATLRRKHGPAMEALFVRTLGQARTKGRLSHVLTGAAGVWDVVRRGLYERGRGRAGWNALDTLRQDLVHALRSLRSAPGFTAMVVAMLAVGIGANSAIFSVLDAVLLRPLPFPNAGRVVNLAWDAGEEQLYSGLTPVKYQYWEEHARTLERVATWQSFLARLDHGGEVSGLPALRVSRGFLDVLGYAPALGRDFADAEHEPPGTRVTLISNAMWQERFGASPDVLGRTLVVDGEPHTVAGVLPASFAFPYVDEPVGAILPVGLRVDPNDQGHNWPAIATLREGVGHEEAQAEMASLNALFRAAHPDHVYERDRGMTLASFGELYVRDAVRTLWILMGAVALVLLIACANVANLFLARAVRRRGEIALRAALGATRGRIVRLVLLESLLVAIAAGALGLLLASGGARALVSLTPAALPRMESIGLDGRVLLFTSGAALLTSLLFGAVTAWPAVRPELAQPLKDGARGSAGRSRVRQGLLVGQSALSMILLVAAGLLLVTWVGLKRVDPGFDPEGLIAVRVPVAPSGDETSRDLWEFQRRVEEEVGRSSSIASIAGASNLPLERGINFPISIAGQPEFGGSVEWRSITPGYFRTLGIRIVAGRPFDDTDLEGAPAVAVVNETFARRYFPDTDPIGQRIDVGRVGSEWRDSSRSSRGVEIVGVVADIREISLRSEARRTMYVPAAQAPVQISTARGTMPVFVARASSAGGDVERLLTEAVRRVDPALPAPSVIPLHSVVAASLARERFGASIVSVFAGLALGLTAFGIYAALAYTVRQQRREIGIRMALGAGGPQVMRLVMGHGMGPVLIGLLVGAACSVGLSRIVASYLWGVPPTDPRTFVTVAAILLGVAALASGVPAHHAAKLDPVRALSRE